MSILQDLHAAACAIAEEDIRTHGKAPAFFLAILLDGRAVTIPTPWDSQEEKELYVTAIRVLCNEGVIHSYSFVTEAWLAVVDPKTQQDLMHVAPRERSDREDVLIVLSRNKVGEKYATKFHVEYGKRKRVTLGEAETLEGDFENGLIGNLFNAEPTYL
jgi:hypothetical protein